MFGDSGLVGCRVPWFRVEGLGSNVYGFRSIRGLGFWGTWFRLYGRLGHFGDYVEGFRFSA